MHTAMLEIIARQRGGEPPATALEHDTSIDDTQHAANWEDIIIYLTTIDMDSVISHVPLLVR